MNRLNLLFAAVVLAAIVAVAPAANAAPTVHFLGAGSSAMFTGFAVAASNDLAHGGVNSVHHYTVKGGSPNCPSNPACAQLVDTRSGSIPKESSNLWVVYTCVSAACTGSDAVEVWAYHQVDSTVGVRTFLSRPAGCGSPCNTSATKSVVDSGTTSAMVGMNLVNPALFQDGVHTANAGCPASGAGTNTCDDSLLPTDVWTAISGALGVSINAGLTDIRPEDAKYATKRLNKPLDTVKWDGLGYGTAGSALQGATIKSAFSGAGATPVNFGLPGTADPFNTTVIVPATITVIPVGESPILFITNRTNLKGLGAGINTTTVTTSAPKYNDVTDYGPLGSAGVPTVYPLGKLFKGKDCEGNAGVFGAGTNVIPPGGASISGITLVAVPGKGGAGTADYKYTSVTGTLAAGQPLSVVGMTAAGNNGVFTITALNPGGTVNKIEVALTTQVAASGQAGLALTNNFAIHVIEREGLSGTMNTTEYTSLRMYGSTQGSQNASIPVPTNSQEANIIVNNGVGDNPLLSKPCIISYGPAGDRSRAIGTGEEVSKVKAIADSIGYAFFSFGNVSPLALTSNGGTSGTATPWLYGYLTLDGVDPLFTSYSGGVDPGQPAGNTVNVGIAGAPGQLPACDFLGSSANPACTAAAIWGSSGSTFPHLRDGTYRAWSLLRGMCDTADPNCTSPKGLTGLIASAQADIDGNTGVPDFLPFNDISFYRSHFQSGANFGFATGPAGKNTPEAGGDVGGCIFATPPDNLAAHLNCHQ